MFSVTSRYSGIETAQLQVGEDRIVVYVRRRFLPQPEELAQVQQHIVSAGERLDQVAAAYLNDPEQFWRVADANAAMRPEDLMTPVGRLLRVTLPQGIPGAPNAR
jgi:hypothetical protein